MSTLLEDIDKEITNNVPSPVSLGDEFMYKGQRCKVVVRYKHAFDYIIPGVTPGPMDGINRITYAYWQKWVGTKMVRC